MSYSQTKLPNDPTAFDPPLYAVWIEEARITWDHSHGQYTARHSYPPLGQIRHFSDLSKAKSRITRHATLYTNRDKFIVDWAIYQWNGTKYELIYDGIAGQVRAENELFKQKISNKTKVKSKKALDDEIEAAVQSILKAGV